MGIGHRHPLEDVPLALQRDCLSNRSGRSERLHRGFDSDGSKHRAHDLLPLLLVVQYVWRSRLVRLPFLVHFHLIGLFLVEHDVLLHAFEVNFVVKVYDVPRVSFFMVHDAFGVDVGHVSLEFKHLGIVVDDRVESCL